MCDWITRRIGQVHEIKAQSIRLANISVYGNSVEAHFQ